MCILTKNGVLSEQVSIISPDSFGSFVRVALWRPRLQASKFIRRMGRRFRPNGVNAIPLGSGLNTPMGAPPAVAAPEVHAEAASSTEAPPAVASSAQAVGSFPAFAEYWSTGDVCRTPLRGRRLRSCSRQRLHQRLAQRPLVRPRHRRLRMLLRPWRILVDRVRALTDVAEKL